MTKQSVCRAAIIAFGMIAVLGARARADEAVDSTRETIIQSVRDDVRRKIRERSEMRVEHRQAVASEAKRAVNAPARATKKPDVLR